MRTQLSEAGDLPQVSRKARGGAGPWVGTDRSLCSGTLLIVSFWKALQPAPQSALVKVVAAVRSSRGHGGFVCCLGWGPRGGSTPAPGGRAAFAACLRVRSTCPRGQSVGGPTWSRLEDAGHGPAQDRVRGVGRGRRPPCVLGRGAAWRRSGQPRGSRLLSRSGLPLPLAPTPQDSGIPEGPPLPDPVGIAPEAWPGVRSPAGGGPATGQPVLTSGGWGLCLAWASAISRTSHEPILAITGSWFLRPTLGIWEPSWHLPTLLRVCCSVLHPEVLLWGHPGTQQRLLGSHFQAEKATAPLGDGGETAHRPEVPLGPERTNLLFGPCGNCPVPGEHWSASVCRGGLGGVALPLPVQLEAARPAPRGGSPLPSPRLSVIRPPGKTSTAPGAVALAPCPVALSSRAETAKCKRPGSPGSVGATSLGRSSEGPWSAAQATACPQPSGVLQRPAHTTLASQAPRSTHRLLL